MLKEFGPEIWIAEGPTVRAAAGFHYPTRMAIIRLSSEGLVVWSPVAFSPELGSAVDALGTVRYIVPPNSLHDTFLAEWQQAYPDAAILAPPGLRKKRPDLVFAGELAGITVPGWQAEIDVVVVPGNRITSEAVLFHRASGTAIFADLLQQFSPGWFKGWRALVARLDLMTRQTPSVPRKFRLAFTNRDAARFAVRQILDWPSKRVLIAHGTPVSENGQAFLKDAFRWLIKS